MTEYIIKQGADCRIAVEPSGFGKQAADIKVMLEIGVLETTRLNHLRKLLVQMLEIPDEELPKTINIPD